MRSIRRAASTVLALLALGLTACDDDRGAASLPAPAEAEKGAAVDVDAFVDALEGSFDDGATARVAFEVDGAARLRGRGTVAYGADGMDVDIRISDWQVAGGWINLRTVGGSAYMKVPESRGLWVDIGADDAGLADSVLEGADPRDQVATLREEISEVRFSGDETVAGVETRRYQVVSESAEEGTGPVVTEYWFDGEGRVVRRSTGLDDGAAEFSWLDWDAPTGVDAPPEDTVITLQQLERLRREKSGQD